MPLLGPSGLSVPVFGPLAQTSVLMPPWELQTNLSSNDIMQALVLDRDPVPATGKRKEPKRFKVPGDSRNPEMATGYGIIPSDDGRQAILHPKGCTAGSQEDGAAILADALLSAGILQERDWCGGLERTVTRGLTRWANEDKGAASWRWFGPPLALVLTDDSPAYAMGCVLSRFRDHMRLRPDRPVGFFGLRWQSSPRPVHVRRVVQEIEARFPSVGYGILNLLEMTFITAAQGYGPLWGMKMATRWGLLDSADSRLLSQMLDGPGTLDDEEADDDPYHFGDCVPLEACMTNFRLDKLDAAFVLSEDAPTLRPVLAAARDVFDACRRAGLRYHTLNHCQFLSWNMSVGERNRGKVSHHRIDRLDRAPVVYTVWDPDNDVMTRLVDDYTEFARTTMQYTDLTWMHCYQAGFQGREPEGAAKWLAAHERKVQRMAKKSPENLSFIDRDYKPAPMPDGGIMQAITALDICLDILGALDRLLSLLHTPETFEEMYRPEQIATGNWGL